MTLNMKYFVLKVNQNEVND